MRSAGESRVPSPALRPGQVFWMPPGATWLNRDKARPFALAAAPSALRTATLAYGSTQEAEKSLGAASVQIAPQSAGVNRNGLRVATSFYPGILLRRGHDLLPEHAGTLGRAADSFKACLRRALGINQGSCLDQEAPAGSLRGRIVKLRPTLFSLVQTRFAVVLTEAGYSRSRNYQVILPILPGDGRAPAESVWQVPEREWFSVFPRRPVSILLPIPVVQSVWHAADIVRETRFVAGADILGEIDRRLCEFFLLPPPDMAG